MPLPFHDEDIAPDRWGATLDKEDDAIEGSVPYAWSFYQALQSAQGKAFSKAREGYLHAENLADARQLAALFRGGEKLQHNAFPRRADESLQMWVDDMAIRVYPDDTDDDVRAKVYARFLAWSGNSPTYMDAAIAALLGPAFVKVERFTSGSLDEPAERTFWPGINPGPTTFDLGTNGGDVRERHKPGAWYSDHSRILVVADEDAPVPRKKLIRALNVDLADLLSRRLPATTSYAWAFSASFPVGRASIGTAAVAGAGDFKFQDIPGAFIWFNADDTIGDDTALTAWKNLMTSSAATAGGTVAPRIDMVRGRRWVRFSGNGATVDEGSWFTSTDQRLLPPFRHVSSQANFYLAITYQAIINGDGENVLLAASQGSQNLQISRLAVNTNHTNRRATFLAGSGAGIQGLWRDLSPIDYDVHLIEILSTPDSFREIRVDGVPREAYYAYTTGNQNAFDVFTLGAEVRNNVYNAPANARIRDVFAATDTTYAQRASVADHLAGRAGIILP